MAYTELAPIRQQFHVAPAMSALKYNTSVDIKKEELGPEGTEEKVNKDQVFYTT